MAIPPAFLFAAACLQQRFRQIPAAVKCEQRRSLHMPGRTAKLTPIRGTF
jgi:hypothetical protein